MKIVGCFLVVIISVLSIQAQIVVPFRLTEHNNIIVKTVVNDRDSLDLMFQIAMTDAAISPKRVHQAHHILFGQNGVSEGNMLEIGSLKWNDITFIDNQLSGPESDGKIGTILFKNKVFKIDYDNSQFVIYDKMPETKAYKLLPLTYRDEALYIDVNSIIAGQGYKHPFYLQSGYAGGLLYDNQFSDRIKLSDRLPVSNEKILKNSAGQSVVTKNAILAEMDIADIALKNVSVGFFVGDLKMQHQSLFGADLLKRFNWIFDADRKVAYIQPSKYFNAKYLEIK